MWEQRCVNIHIGVYLDLSKQPEATVFITTETALSSYKNTVLMLLLTDLNLDLCGHAHILVSTPPLMIVIMDIAECLLIDDSLGTW